MRWTTVPLIALSLFWLSTPLPSAAQSGAVQDTTQPAPKKKGGLFGKVKGLAKNKVIQQVAKTAACNMVPGGSMLVGAVDKSINKQGAKDAAKDAAKNAAVGAAASGLAGGKGNPCGPGLMGNPSSALAGVGGPGAGLPGMPTVGMPGRGISAEQLKQMQQQYQKAGVSSAQIQAMQRQMMANPAGGMSPEQLKQVLEQYQKMGMDPAQLQAMQQMMAGMQPGDGAPATAVSAPATAATAPAPTAAASALTREKNRLVLRRLPWSNGSEAIQAGSEQAFQLAIGELAGSIVSGDKHYKIEVRVEEQGSKAKNQALAQKRAATVLTALVSQGVPQNRLTAAGGGADKDPRVVVSETK